MKVLVIAELGNKAAMDACVIAAESISDCPDISIVEISQNAAPENIEKAIIEKHNAESFTHIIAPANTWGKDFMPRVAASRDVQQVSDITAVNSHDTFTRPIYAGNVFLKLKSNDGVKIITVRVSAFSGSPKREYPISKVSLDSKGELSEFIELEAVKSERPELQNAKIVVSGGKGLANAENFKALERIADLLGAGIGASRAAVDMGLAPNDWQVGQTGKIIAPEVYFAFGISGAIQHLAGMNESRIIVAINKDENAPICEIADYSLIGDVNILLPEIEEYIKKNK